MMTNEYCELNYGQIFFMMSSFIPVALCFPCWIVAKFVYEPFVKQVENEKENIPEIPFEFQFPIEKASNDRDSESSFKKCIVLSNTPDGLVYMRYTKEEEGFEYWSDTTINYKYLETVARKYVTVFSCSSLYIDRFALLMTKITNLKEQISKNQEEKNNKAEEDKEIDEDDVFANLKSYNKKGKGTGDVTDQTEIKRKDVVCDEANKYIKRGKIKEANFGEQKPKETPASSMSFVSWKLWRSEKKED